MYLISPKYEIIERPNGRKMTKLIERVARDCYQSFDKVGEDSDLALVGHLIDQGHMPMIEFGHDMVVRVTSDRGFSHELVRHRMASFAQESTRWCNYHKKKFGGQISIVDIPDDWLKMPDDASTRRARKLMLDVYETSETNYNKLIEMGVPAEIARNVLPQGLRAIINIKGNPREWRHIFSLRCSKRAHPRMRELMIPLLHEVASEVPLIYDDLREKFPIHENPAKCIFMPGHPIDLNDNSKGYQYVNK